MFLGSENAYLILCARDYNNHRTSSIAEESQTRANLNVTEFRFLLQNSTNNKLTTTILTIRTRDLANLDIYTKYISLRHRSAALNHPSRPDIRAMTATIMAKGR